MHTLTTAPAPAWTPASLGADLIAWFDVRHGLTFPGGMASWADVRGAGHPVASALGSSPTLDPTGIAGGPGLLFDHYLEKLVVDTQFPIGNAHRHYILMFIPQSVGTGTGYPLWTGPAPASGGIYFAIGLQYTSVPRLHAGSGSGYGFANLAPPSSIMSNTLQMANAYFDGAEAGIAKNNNAHTTVSPVILNTGGASLPMIGQRPGGGTTTDFVGHLGMLAAVSRRLTPDELTKFLDYYNNDFAMW